MIDVHCHLNFKAFKDDYDEVIKRAFEARVRKIINVGTKIDTSEKAVKLAEKYENLYAIVGVHPHHADKTNVILGNEATPESDSGQVPPQRDPAIGGARMTKSDDWIRQIERLAQHPKVVAIGECGIDYYRYKTNGIVEPNLQREVFIKQIKLAHALKKPLQIHNRHAGSDILDILTNHKSYLLNPPGMFHCMSGDLAFLKKVLRLGFYIGFDGNITYEGLAPGEDTDLKELVKATPLARILVETDSPYLTPEPRRGSRNEPKHAIIIGQFIAKLKNISYYQTV